MRDTADTNYELRHPAPLADLVRSAVAPPAPAHRWGGEAADRSHLDPSVRAPGRVAGEAKDDWYGRSVVSLAERYENGDREAVWAELVEIGALDGTPGLRQDAERVAALTMQRAATNVATLTIHLTARGYRFANRYSRNRRRRTIEDLGLRRSMEAAGRDLSWVDEGDVEETVMGWAGPRPDVGEHIDAAERAIGGPLPLSVRFACRYLDVVDLAGSFPGWIPSAFDFDDDLDWPAAGLVTDPVNLLGIDCVTDHVDPATGRVDALNLHEGHYVLPIANGPELSANQIGAMKTVRLTATDHGEAVDPFLHGVPWHPGIRFVEYLRLSFAWAGFPGFSVLESDPPSEIRRLQALMLPL